jgi:hypothetical protein
MTSRHPIPEVLRRFVVADRIEDDIEILDLPRGAELLEEAAETVVKWIQQKELLAWHDRKGDLRIPAEQILGPHRVVRGLARILKVIPDARAAWDFLTRESPFFAGEPKRPMDELKTGHIEDVVRASYSHGEAFS